MPAPNWRGTALDIAIRALRSIARDGAEVEAQDAANALAEMAEVEAIPATHMKSGEPK